MPSAETLTNAALRLAQAVARHELERTVDSADEVIAARLAVKDAFIDAGWQPSERSLREMEADRNLLAESAGILDRRESDAGDGQGRHERVAVRHVVPSIRGRIVHVGGGGGLARSKRSPAPWRRPLPGFA